MTPKWGYLFEEGNVDMRDLLGGKGANLAEMVNFGMPVPPGFIISTEVCLAYLRHNHTLPDGMCEQIRQGLGAIRITVEKGRGTRQNFEIGVCGE